MAYKNPPEAMKFFIFDQDFNQLGAITNYKSVKWHEEYQGRGSFYLECVDTKDNISLLQQGRYCARKGYNTAMVFRYDRKESAESSVMVRGFTTLDLIRQRVVAGTKSVYNVENGMYSIVKEQLRGMPYLDTAPEKGFGYVSGTQFTGTNVLDAQIALAESCGLGFRMNFDTESKRHIFEVYEGVDRTYEQTQNDVYMFGEKFRNMNNIIIIDDMQLYANVAYVAGGGEGAERKWVEVGDVEGLDRFEIFVDARDLQQVLYEDGNETILTDEQYEERLISRGIQKLNDHLHAQSFSGDVDPSDWGTKYNLGDIVTCESQRYGVRLNARITEFTEVRENNMPMLSLTLGTPEITYIDVIRSWMN